MPKNIEDELNFERLSRIKCGPIRHNKLSVNLIKKFRQIQGANANDEFPLNAGAAWLLKNEPLDEPWGVRVDQLSRK
jgi:hypothetical protein